MSYKLDKSGDYLNGARIVSSPNHDERPDNTNIDLLVIHGISLPPDEYGGDYIDQLFTNKLNPEQHPYFEEIQHLRVSSHLMINRAGIVTQYVPFSKRAWHAGVSCFADRERCNDFSIGIELEGSDTVPYTDSQYETLAIITNLLCQRWQGITKDRIVGHSDIAPGRKTDPGPAFDKQRFFSLLKI